MPQIPHMTADLLGRVVFVPGQAVERVLARAADVIMNESANARGVRLAKCTRDVGMLGRHALDGAGRPGLVGEQPVRRAMRPHRVERSHHEAVAARRAERPVEVAVGLEAPAPPLRERCEVLHRLAIGVRGARRRERGRGRLEQLAQLVQLAHVGGGEALHERAAPRHEANEPLLLEQVQRLAHGRA
jgi:hypothetical protein